MSNQLEISFSVHTHENNHDSKRHLEENRNNFSNQNKKVYDLLKSGQELSCRTAMMIHHIGHLPRRIKDLRESGVNVLDRWEKCIEDKTRFKIYFL